MTSGQEFLAAGPSFAAFSTFRPPTRPIVYGANVKGTRCGVYGESALSGESAGESDVDGVGVSGEGELFGVFGKNARGIAGVFGAHHRAGIGTIGAALDVIPLHQTQPVGGTGVVGASTTSLNTAHFAPVRDPERGSGIGVLGTSGTGAGVRGSSASGPGVQGESSTGHGVHGEGQSGVVGTSSSRGFSGVSGRHTGSGYGVVGDGAGSTNAGVLGRNRTGHGVRGEGRRGVVGTSSFRGFSGVYGQHVNNGYGVVGDGAGFSHAGVFGRNGEGTGVQGDGATGVLGHGQGGEGSVGVLGRNGEGTGVQGEGSMQAEDVAGVRGLGKTGVWGSSSAAGRSGVYGQHTGEGYGVVGDGGGQGNAGILGRNSLGDGVRGEGFNGVVGTSSAMGAGTAGFAPAGVLGRSSSSGPGVLGRSSSGAGVRGKGDYGGEFEGTSAQLRLVPGSAAGHPTTGAHAQGEIYMDSEANLWVCTAGGTPGTWKQVTLS